MRKGIIFVLALAIAALSIAATPNTRRRAHARHTSSAEKTAADKSAAEAKVARDRIASELKTLTHFMYLLGGIEKGIELSGDAATGPEVSPAALALNDRNKAKVKASITTVREGLEKLETDFRMNPALKNYSTYLTGLANHGEAAESQAAANHLNEAGKSLLKAVDQLTDALAAIH